MAKGLRSKSKVAARRIKRQDPASIYKITAEQRIQQASARLAALAKQPKISSSSLTSSSSDDADADADADGAAAAGLMEEDDATTSSAAADKPKVSTSGTRGSRRETWRAARGWKPRVGSKNGGRTKRRR